MVAAPWCHWQKTLVRFQTPTAGAITTTPVRISLGHRTVAWLVVTLVEPLAEFFRRNGVRFALSILLFVLLFKVGEAFLGRMSIVFFTKRSGLPMLRLACTRNW